MIDEEDKITPTEDTAAPIAEDNDEPFFTISEVPPAQAVIVSAESEPEAEPEEKEIVDNKATTDQEEVAESEVEQEDAEENTSKPVKDKKWKVDKKLREEHKRILDIANQLAEENSYLKNLTGQALDYNQDLKTQNIDGLIEDTAAARVIAIQKGDGVEYTKHDIRLNDLLAERRRLVEQKQERIAAQNTHVRQSSQQSSQEGNSRHLEDQWFARNPELDGKSPVYDNDFTQEMIGIFKQIDGKLQENGDEDWIGTPQYFNYLQAHVDKVRVGGQKNPIAPSKPMYSTKHIGGVRGAPASGTAVKEAVVLTPEQKEIATLFKIPAEVYLKRYNAAERQRLGHK